MAYSTEINRVNPSCLLFIIDQSGSMIDTFPGTTKRKADFVADVINRQLQELVIKCAKSDGVRDYYHVGVIGYSGAAVGSALGGVLTGRTLVPISQVAEHPVRIDERTKKTDDGAGGLVDQIIKFPIWFDPTASGPTPMCRAIELASTTLSAWLSEHPACFPPIVIHLTDGEPTDGDPTVLMQKLTELASADGNVVLFNVHISSNPNAVPLIFPGDSEQLPDAYAQMLFNTASPLIPSIRAIATEYRFTLVDTARCFILNADQVLIIEAVDIGTRPSNLR